MKLLTRAYTLLITCSEFLQPIILLIFRAHWGWILFLAGKGKLINHPDIVDFFTGLGIPFPAANAWFVAGLECFGGLLLVVGLCSRPIALMMAVNMIVAYLSVAEDRGKFLGVFSDAEAFISAEPFFFMLMSFLVLAFGPGALSLNALLRRRFKARK